MMPKSITPLKTPFYRSLSLYLSAKPLNSLRGTTEFSLYVRTLLSETVSKMQIQDIYQIQEVVCCNALLIITLQNK